jgi:hypothetical protein
MRGERALPINLLFSCFGERRATLTPDSGGIIRTSSDSRERVWRLPSIAEGLSLALASLAQD